MNRHLAFALLTLGTAACMGDVQQVAGTGAVYVTSCSADMMVTEDDTYRANCNPPPCGDGFADGPISQVVVALDPGRKVIGRADRVCVQDLARASELFNPALFKPENTRKPVDPAGEEITD